MKIEEDKERWLKLENDKEYFYNKIPEASSEALIRHEIPMAS